MLKFKKAFMMRARKPRIDVIMFVGKLHKDDMLKPQIAEYTYTGKETIHKRPDTHSKVVEEWSIEGSRRTYKIEILETKGNYIKFQFRLTGKEGWSTILNDPDNKDCMNMRVMVYARMGNPTWMKKPTGITHVIKVLGSKRSKVYHKSDCYIVKRIKKPIEITEEQKAKRRLCKRE